MKCIVRLYGLGGGAPRSILQHLKIYAEHDYSQITCLACETDKYLKQEYEKNGFHVINRKGPSQLWDEHHFIQLYREYKWELDYLQKENPDLIVATDEMNGAFYSHACACLGIPLIIYIPGGDITINENVIQLWKDCEVVCFSKENEDVINKYKIDKNHIHVITNRIVIREYFDDVYDHYQKTKESIHILLVSRICEDKMQSIYHFISLLSQCASEDIPIQLRIAGRGEWTEELDLYIENNHNQSLEIHRIGHKNDLTEEFRWAHIVAGKGRSVMEPIIMRRIGCVISDIGNIQFCNRDTFDNLYHYNFAGRNMPPSNPVDKMRKMLSKIWEGDIVDNDITVISELARKHYSAEFLSDKVIHVIENISSPASKKTRTQPFKLYCRVLMKKTIGKWKRYR